MFPLQLFFLHRDRSIDYQADRLQKFFLYNLNKLKVSYFPNWKVEGADKVYFAAPAFMIIYPQQENVRLYYGLTWVDKISYSLSIIAWIYILFLFFKKCFRSKSKKGKKHFWRFF